MMRSCPKSFLGLFTHRYVCPYCGLRYRTSSLRKTHIHSDHSDRLKEDKPPSNSAAKKARAQVTEGTQQVLEASSATSEASKQVGTFLKLFQSHEFRGVLKRSESICKCNSEQRSDQFVEGQYQYQYLLRAKVNTQYQYSGSLEVNTQYQYSGLPEVNTQYQYQYLDLA